MSWLIKDDTNPKKKVVSVNYFSGLPQYESPTQYHPQREARQPRQKPVSFKENYNTIKGIGKGVHKAYQLSRKHYGNRLPYDVDSTIARAKSLKAQEKKAKEYQEARDFIMDFEGRQAEYESQHPRSFKDKLFGRRKY